MVDRTMPIVPIKLDKERHLKFGLKALKAIEKATGKSALSGELWREPTVTNFSILLWAGLLHEDPDLTIEQVDELVDTYSSIGTISEAITEAWGVAMPEAEKGKEGEGDNQESPLA